MFTIPSLPSSAIIDATSRASGQTAGWSTLAGGWCHHLWLKDCEFHRHGLVFPTTCWKSKRDVKFIQPELESEFQWYWRSWGAVVGLFSCWRASEFQLFEVVHILFIQQSAMQFPLWTGEFRYVMLCLWPSCDTTSDDELGTSCIRCPSSCWFYSRCSF